MKNKIQINRINIISKFFLLVFLFVLVGSSVLVATGHEGMALRVLYVNFIFLLISIITY